MRAEPEVNTEGIGVQSRTTQKNANIDEDCLERMEFKLICKKEDEGSHKLRGGEGQLDYVPAGQYSGGTSPWFIMMKLNVSG